MSTGSKKVSAKVPRETGISKSGELFQSSSKVDTSGTSEKKKRKRRKRTKNSTISEGDSSKHKMQTNANYPKELSLLDNVSCNWKKLCQTSQVAKSSNPKKTDNEPWTLNKPVPHRSANGKPSSARADTRIKPNEIWFDGVDKELLEPAETTETSIQKGKSNTLVRKGSFTGLTRAVAMDCEMVGTGVNGVDSVLARVSIVNLMGSCIYDKYVKCTDVITDYRTPVSGIRPSDLEKGEAFSVVQKEVSDILHKRTLVGHAVHNDLKVLFLTHPRRKIRDTSTYKPFRKACGSNTPSLKSLSQKILSVSVQEGEHNSVQDAQAAMRLYTMHKVEWENSLNKKQHRTQLAKNKGSPKSDHAKVKKQTNSPTTRKMSQLKL